jgi:hypothetical protein
MTYKYLIKHGGEMHLTNDLAGYKGRKILARNVPRPPSDHCTWQGGKWVEDKAAKATAKRHAQLRGLSRPDLVAMLEGQIQDLQRQIDELRTMFTASGPQSKGKR